MPKIKSSAENVRLWQRHLQAIDEAVLLQGSSSAQHMHLHHGTYDICSDGPHSARNAVLVILALLNASKYPYYHVT